MRITTILALTLAYSASAARILDTNSSGLEIYTQVVDLLNATYGGTCIVMATGLLPATPTVTVRCTDMGGEAVLKCEDAGESVDPKTLEVCDYGDEMKKTCQSMTFTGTLDEDMDAVDALVFGDYAGSEQDGTDFDEVYDLLDKRYDGNCNFQVTGLQPATVTTTVVCTQPGGQATLTASGAVDPQLESLEVCGFGAYMIKTCHSIEFTGDAKTDMAALNQIL